MSVALVRGQASDCGNPLLNLTTQINGVPVELASLAYRIFDKTGAVPVQVYPAGTDRADVTLDPCPLGDVIDAGRYVARWVVPLAEPIGLHEVRWYYKLTSASIEKTLSEEFYVAASSTLAPSEYTTVQELRDQGIAQSAVSDVVLATKIKLASMQIDRWCGQWFYPRPMTLLLDGVGGRILQLGVPIISVQEVTIYDSEVEPGAMFVYNRHVTQGLTNPDDRNNPKIEFHPNDDLFAAGYFRSGSQNVRIVGRFGYTDYDGTPDGKTPDLIRLACGLLVVRSLPKIGDVEARDEARMRSRVTAIRTRDQEITWASPGTGSGVGTRGTGAFSGDPEIDNIIASYRRPPVLGAA